MDSQQHSIAAAPQSMRADQCCALTPSLPFSEIFSHSAHEMVTLALRPSATVAAV